MAISDDRFCDGALVRKKTGYKFTGSIVSRFTKLDGQVRFVVENVSEDCEGMLHIFSEKDLELIP